MKTKVVPASKLGDDWRASGHVKVEASLAQLFKLGKIQQEQRILLQKLERLQKQEMQLVQEILSGK